MNSTFEWAKDFVFDCYDAAVTWFGMMMNSLGAFEWILRIFFVVVVFTLFVIPLRGFGLNGALPLDSAGRNYGVKGLPAGSSDSARRRKK